MGSSGPIGRRRALLRNERRNAERLFGLPVAVGGEKGEKGKGISQVFTDGRAGIAMGNAGPPLGD